MLDIKLVYFEGCPNAEKVRRELKESGFDFQEVRQDILPEEDPFQEFSSPALLVNEVLVFGTKTGSGGGCTLQVPSSDEIEQTLRQIDEGDQ